jgi:hypothetical protein
LRTPSRHHARVGLGEVFSQAGRQGQDRARALGQSANQRDTVNGDNRYGGAHVAAYYLWMTRKGKQYWEVPPMTCELTPTLAEKQLCENREQFDALVTPFMTQ